MKPNKHAKNMYTVTEVGTLLESMDQKIKHVLEVTAPLSGRFTGVEERLSGVEEKLSGVGDRLVGVETAVRVLSKRVSGLELKVGI